MERAGSRCGFTLVELMVAATLLASVEPSAQERSDSSTPSTAAEILAVTE